MTTPEDRKTGYLDACFVVLIWSGFVLISRIGGKSELLSYDVVALRFGVAAIVLLPMWARNKVNLLQPKLLVLSLIGGIGYCTLVYLGFRHAPAAHAGILLPGFLPFESAFFAWLMLHERPTARRLAGLLVIALGVLSLASESIRDAGSTWLGDITFLAAGTLWALYATLVRKWHVQPWEATIGLALVSAALYLPVYILCLPKGIMIAPWHTIALQGFYQGFMAMVVAMIFYMRAMKAIGPTKLGLCMALVPAISGLAAIPLLGEALSLPVALGLLLTTLGAWLGSRG